MDTAIIRITGALLCLGLSYRVISDWNPNFGVRAADESVRTGELMKQAETYNEKHLYRQALGPAEALYKGHPANHVYIQQLAIARQGVGRHREAAVLWEEYLQHAPVPAEACPQIGIAYRNAGLTTEAGDALHRCLEFEASNPDVLYALGDLQMAMGSLPEAEASFRKGLLAMADDTDLMLGMARLDLRRGQVARATAAADGVLTKFPENTDALLVAGLAAIERGDLAGARVFLERGVRLSTRDLDIRKALALVDAREKQLPEEGK